MSIKQLSIFVENKPGRLADITKTLSEKEIDIRALSIADTTNFGILRIIVDRPEQAEASLKQAGFTVSQTEVIAIGIDDKPGGLSQALDALYRSEVAVEYMYAFISRDDKTAYVIIRVEDNGKALQVLEKTGIQILTDREIYEM